MAQTLFTIETERLVLRPFELTDLESTHEYASDTANTEYMLYLPNSSIKETEQFLNRVVAEWKNDTPQSYEFAIMLDGKHIGAVSASLGEDIYECELGWIIHKDYQHRGYATEAAKATRDFALTQLKAKKVVAHCDYRNMASFRVMEKIGLTLECDKGTRQYRDSDKDIRELKYSLVVDND